MKKIFMYAIPIMVHCYADFVCFFMLNFFAANLGTNYLTA